MKTLLTLLFALFLVGSATAGGKEKSISSGTYGICNCSDDAYVSEMIQLQLNPDHTFSYKDNTLGKASFAVTGSWEQHGNKIVLIANDGKKNMHLRWKASGEQCIRSRRGLNFRRLCLMQKC